MASVIGPALGCLLVLGLCAVAAVHLWHLGQFQHEQYAQLSELETTLQQVRNQKQRRQAELTRRFDPQQIQPLLRERYGWVDPRDLIVRLKTPTGL